MFTVPDSFFWELLHQPWPVHLCTSCDAIKNNVYFVKPLQRGYYYVKLNAIPKWHSGLESHGEQRNDQSLEGESETYSALAAKGIEFAPKKAIASHCRKAQKAIVERACSGQAWQRGAVRGWKAGRAAWMWWRRGPGSWRGRSQHICQVVDMHVQSDWDHGRVRRKNGCQVPKRYPGAEERAPESRAESCVWKASSQRPGSVSPAGLVLVMSQQLLFPVFCGWPDAQEQSVTLMISKVGPREPCAYWLTVGNVPFLRLTHWEFHVFLGLLDLVSR